MTEECEEDTPTERYCGSEESSCVKVLLRDTQEGPRHRAQRSQTTCWRVWILYMGGGEPLTAFFVVFWHYWGMNSGPLL